MSLLQNIDNEMKKLTYDFKKPPILIGGGAMEHYGMRETGHDYDFMICIEDYKELKRLGKHLNTFGGKEIDADGLSTDMDNTFTSIDGLNIDLAVTMFQYRYEFFDHRTDVLGPYKVVSREHLLLMKSLAASNNDGWDTGCKNYMIKKQRHDMDLILKSIVEYKYKQGDWDNAISFNTPTIKINDVVQLIL